MKIGFIGCGNMGEAILSTILAKKLGVIAADITVSDVSEERRNYVASHYQVTATDDNLMATEKANVIVLAIKPQSLATVASGLKGRFNPDKLVLSIVAGASIKKLGTALGHSCLVRSMPNTPALIGQGMTVWTATADVTKQQKKWAGVILGALGKEIYVSDEKYLDMATAVSGSGPAYFFLFVESLTEAAVNIGLPRDMAGQLVLQTMLGSAQLIKKSSKTPAELRRMVTSPGGTTAEAIARFENGGFSQLVLDAVRAAHERAKELGK